MLIGWDEIEQLRRHLGRLVVAPVAQEPVELLQALGVIDAVALEGDARGFVGVRVIEVERPVARFGGDRLGGRRHQHCDRHKRGKSQPHQSLPIQ
jgi:hypothetical protein